MVFLVIIRLGGCAVLSVSLLFTWNINRFYGSTARWFDWWMAREFATLNRKEITVRA